MTLVSLDVWLATHTVAMVMKCNWPLDKQPTTILVIAVCIVQHTPGYQLTYKGSSESWPQQILCKHDTGAKMTTLLCNQQQQQQVARWLDMTISTPYLENTITAKHEGYYQGISVQFFVAETRILSLECYDMNIYTHTAMLALFLHLHQSISQCFHERRHIFLVLRMVPPFLTSGCRQTWLWSTCQMFPPTELCKERWKGGKGRRERGEGESKRGGKGEGRGGEKMRSRRRGREEGREEEEEEEKRWEAGDMRGRREGRGDLPILDIGTMNIITQSAPTHQCTLGSKGTDRWAFLITPQRELHSVYFTRTAVCLDHDTLK